MFARPFHCIPGLHDPSNYIRYEKDHPTTPSPRQGERMYIAVLLLPDLPTSIHLSQ